MKCRRHYYPLMVTTVNQCSSESPRINNFIGGTRKNKRAACAARTLEQFRAVLCKKKDNNNNVQLLHFRFWWQVEQTINNWSTLYRTFGEESNPRKIHIGHFDSTHLFSLSLLTILVSLKILKKKLYRIQFHVNSYGVKSQVLFSTFKFLF